MSGAEKDNQPSADQPDVSSEGGRSTQPKKAPRAPNLSTKETMMSERQGRQLAPQNDYEPRMEEMTIEKPKVGLNVSAQEFVPGKSHHVLSVDAETFVPKGQQIPFIDYATGYPLEGGTFLEEEFANLVLDGPPPYLGNSDAELDIVVRFRDVLYTLTLNPGNMEEHLKPLCEMIEERAESPYLAKSLCELLLDQSIQEENFRYTGARLCQFLNNNLTQNEHVIGFAKMFITRCGDEFNKRNELLHGSDEDKRNLCGLAIFMAELFLNVETKARDGTRSRFHFMPAKLAEMIMTLLSVPDDMTVKCVCQLLKLVGGLMDDFAKANVQMDDQFKSVFVELRKLLESQISQNIKSLVQSVLELREKNWNRSTTSPPKKEEPVKLDEVTFQQEPVFYHNGKECTREEVDLPDEMDRYPYVLTDEEELAFLEWQAEQEGTTVPWNDTGYDSYQFNEECVADPWMGDDLEAAYEEFLQGQGQSYSIGPGANDTAGFPRHVNTVISQPGVYPLQPAPEEMYSVPYNEGNPHGHPYASAYYEGDPSERMNLMHCPPHTHPSQSQQPYHHPQQMPQQPYDQSYQHHQPPNNSYHPHR